MSASGTAGLCETREGLAGVGGIVMSPNGLEAYATNLDNGLLLTLERDVAPQCQPASASVTAGLAQAITLSCSDVDFDTIEYQTVTSPVGGTLGGISQALATVFYSPFSGFAGPDSFTYRGIARGSASSPANVALNVVAPPAAPAPVVDADGDGSPPRRLQRPQRPDPPGRARDPRQRRRRELRRPPRARPPRDGQQRVGLPFTDHTVVTRPRMSNSRAGKGQSAAPARAARLRRRNVRRRGRVHRLPARLEPPSAASSPARRSSCASRRPTTSAR